MEREWFTLTVKCDNGHKQDIRISVDLGERYAIQQGELLDGSSPFYVQDPRKSESSPIGKCGICHAPVHSTVS